MVDSAVCARPGREQVAIENALLGRRGAVAVRRLREAHAAVGRFEYVGLHSRVGLYSRRNEHAPRCGELMGIAAFLRNVPALAGRSEELLDRLGGEMGERRVKAGKWILREGEAADSAFIVRSGRVEVIDEGPPDALIRVLRRGDVLGELALLREGTRSASARARRDTQLLELSRAGFEALIQDTPSFALGLTRAMGAQLAASRTPVATATPPRTIAVVGLDAGAPVPEIAEGPAGALAAHGSVALLSTGELAAIDQAERAAGVRRNRLPRTPAHTLSRVL
jgi:CRP-like cAMP-binding protein